MVSVAGAGFSFQDCTKVYLTRNVATLASQIGLIRRDATC